MIAYIFLKTLLLLLFLILLFIVYISIQFALIPYRINKIMYDNNYRYRKIQ